eukprot:SAG31_NODE_720_length_12587_cov_15.393114_6_plen_73_part_00
MLAAAAALLCALGSRGGGALVGRRRFVHDVNEHPASLNGTAAAVTREHCPRRRTAGVASTNGGAVARRRSHH